MTRHIALVIACFLAMAGWASGQAQAPDRTPVTAEQLERAIQDVEDKIDLRFESNNRAVKLLQDFANSQPTTEAVDGKLAALKELTQSQFQALTELINARAEGNKVSLDAALVTRKEASDKIENAFNKQMEALANRIDDLKERIDTEEGRGAGRSDFIGWIVAAVAVAGFILTQFVRRDTKS